MPEHKGKAFRYNTQAMTISFHWRIKGALRGYSHPKIVKKKIKERKKRKRNGKKKKEEMRGENGGECHSHSKLVLCECFVFFVFFYFLTILFKF